MTHDDFFAQLKQGAVQTVYLFEGEEAYIKEKALEALRKKMLPEGLEALNESILQNPSAQDVIAAAETLPMMADRRLVLVRDSALLTAGKAANEAEDSQRLSDYLERLPDTTCLLFYCTAAPDGRKKLTQALRKRGAAVSFDRLADASLARWAQQQVRPHGKRIAPDTVQYLAFTAGHELMGLAQELAKLSAYAGEREEITRQDVDLVVTPSLECTVFQMVDQLVAGQEGEAFRLLSIMLENGEGRIGILAMIQRQYRNLMHLCRMQQEGVSERDIISRLGVPPFALRRLKEQVRGETADTLRAKLDLCVDTDYAIKSGKMREDAALERAMFRLCTRQMPGVGV